jgi:hypothetical protein
LPRDHNDRTATLTSMDDVMALIGRLHCYPANGARLRQLWRGRLSVHACIALPAGSFFQLRIFA